MSKCKGSGYKRYRFGQYMPVLRNMSVEEALNTAWEWTIVLSGFDEEN